MTERETKQDILFHAPAVPHACVFATCLCVCVLHACVCVCTACLCVCVLHALCVMLVLCQSAGGGLILCGTATQMSTESVL